MFIRGRLRSEEENPIVRSFIHIYQPLLTWALPRRNLVMWAFAALLVMAAGMFPLQAIVGLGASQTAWRGAFLTVFALVTALTVISTRGLKWQVLSLVSLIWVGLWAFHFDKIGVAFMPPLDEGTTLDMPITVPRASVTQAADDLKARDALLRGFPEVESVIGKAGRADTPTDPAPLDMVETFVNFRPKALWPKRVLRFGDAQWQTDQVLTALEADGYVQKPSTDEKRNELVNDATQNALTRFDETMRAFALERFQEVQQSLETDLTRFAVTETIRMMTAGGQITWPEGLTAESEIDRLSRELQPSYGVWLSKNPSLEDAGRLSRTVANELKQVGAIADVVEALEPVQSRIGGWIVAVKEAIGVQRPTFAGQLLAAIDHQRSRLWQERVHAINWELFDRGMEAYTAYALEELAKEAVKSDLVADAPHGQETQAFATTAVNVQLGKTYDTKAMEPFAALRETLQKPLASRAFLWPRQTGPKGDLVDDEMGRVLQVPGWANIFTQPIINRIEMLSTGVRTDIGVKVFGANLETIDRACKDIEAALKPINGARDVIASPIMGKGYLEINIDRKAAARYGISVEDIQNEIEVALAGRAVTYTVENRDRFPVRIRYMRSEREDEESIRKLLIAANNMAPAGGMAAGQTAAGSMAAASSGGTEAGSTSADDSVSHTASPAHAGKGKTLIPLGALAEIKIVEGPAMIKSENGQLLNYVTLNVRGRDIVGFVDEAQRVVAQKVKLPEGVHVGWAGEFEHQVRAARTLRFVFPAVIAVIFIILYMTYNDLADAALMMMAVPEALAGGAFFLYLFPKITQGWSAPPMDFSVAVWVGFIACFGMATETGIIMLVYLREAIEKRGGLEKIESLTELREAVIEGAVHRLRPKLLTEGVAIIAIFPMVFATGVGGEILAPMALPVLGGLLISDEVVDLFLPVRFYWVRRARWLKLHKNRLAQSPPHRHSRP